MEFQPLTALSPIDGRYRHQLKHLDQYFSEYALIRYRVEVEIAYFLFLAEKKFFRLDAKQRADVRKITDLFSIDDANNIKK